MSASVGSPAWGPDVASMRWISVAGGQAGARPVEAITMVDARSVLKSIVM
jgi:hypothetical protein